MNQSPVSRALKLAVLICAASACLFGLLPGHAAGRDEQQPAPAQAEQLFLEKIATTLAAKCQTCHGEDGAAGLDLRSRESLLGGGQRGAAIIPGDAEKSLLYLALLGRDGFKQMPPGKPLPFDLIAAFKQWIDAGAPWPAQKERMKGAGAPPTEAKLTYAEDDVWAFKPIKRYNAPSIGNAQRVQSPVDAFILQKLNEKAIKPAPQADRATLVRRATFDLHGLPPTPEEVAAFVGDPVHIENCIRHTKLFFPLLYRYLFHLRANSLIRSYTTTSSSNYTPPPTNQPFAARPTDTFFT